MPSNTTCDKIMGQIVEQKLRIKNKLTSLALNKIANNSTNHVNRIVIFNIVR